MAAQVNTRRGAEAGGGPKLKNYRSQSELSTILEAIRQSLVAHGARRVAFEYDASGQASAVEFSLQVQGRMSMFRLPARLQNVEPLVVESYRAASRRIPQGEELAVQTCKTGWANIRDWVGAQMALLRTGMVKPEEIFLPYLLLDGPGGEPITYYEAFELHQALPSPHVSISVREE